MSRDMSRAERAQTAGIAGSRWCRRAARRLLYDVVCVRLTASCLFSPSSWRPRSDARAPAIPRHPAPARRRRDLTLTPVSWNAANVDVGTVQAVAERDQTGGAVLVF